MFCIHCGTPMNDSEKYCVICGRKNNSPQDAFSQEPEYIPPQAGQAIPFSNTVRPKGKLHRIFLIAAVLVFLAVIGTLTFFFLKMQGDEQKNSREIQFTRHSTDSDEKEEETELTASSETDAEQTYVEQTTAEQTTAEQTYAEQTTAPAETSLPVSARIQVVPDSEVENEVLHVREIWNTYRTNIEAGSYSVSTTSEGIVTYSDGSNVVMIEVPQSIEGSLYAKIYTYENGKLIFAFFYNDSEENRLYIKSGQLFRWAYTLGSNDPIVYDNTFDNEVFIEFEGTATAQGDRLLQ